MPSFVLVKIGVKYLIFKIVYTGDFDQIIVQILGSTSVLSLIKTYHIVQ